MFRKMFVQNPQTRLFRPGIALKCLSVFVGMPLAAVPAMAQQTAVLQGLNKITARVSTIEAPIDQAVRFGTLDITVKRCSKRPPEETPESTAYLEIRERRSGERSVDLFAGWMFASSPAVSSMEHPVYDVWVIDCKKASSSD
jgi:hypothetical protein|tara:strand:+ start:62 stop:487 length:426 start_codon:yes stop_codon:yes gene_type:complete